MNKNAVVTGATGFIGYHLCNRLYEDGYRVFALGRKDENKIKCHEFYSSDLSKLSTRDLPKIDVCFHLAANNDTLSKNEEEMMECNYHASISLFKRLFEIGCKKFIYASSSSVYGLQQGPFFELSTPLKGSTCYAKSKISFESFCKGFSERTSSVCVGLRYTNVYGTQELHKKHRASMITQIIQRVRKNESPQLFFDGTQTRDWVYILDAIDANILATKCNSSGVFNIGSGDNVSFNNILDLVNKKMGKNIQAKYVECKIQDVFQTHNTVDLGLSRKILDYKPKYKVDDGIQDIKSRLKDVFSTRLVG